MTRSWKWPGLLGGGRPHVHPLESKPWEWKRPSTPPRLTESSSPEFTTPSPRGSLPRLPMALRGAACWAGDLVKVAGPQNGRSST